jgi:hypothetical protein
MGTFIRNAMISMAITSFIACGAASNETQPIFGSSSARSTVVDDAEFEYALSTFVTNAMSVKTAQEARFAEMTPEELDRVIAEGDSPWPLTESPRVDTYYEDSDIDPGAVQEMQNAVQILLGSLDLEQATRWERAQAVGDLVLGHITEHGHEYGFSEVADDYEPTEEACIELCKIRYAAKVAQATTVYAIALAASGATLIGAIIATGTYAGALASAQKENDLCIAACEGEDIGDYCSTDNDCKPKEYCWKGVAGWNVFGMAPNECRPKKANGKVCDRPGKCNSGCCKYHPASHLLSFVCRPSSKC